MTDSESTSESETDMATAKTPQADVSVEKNISIAKKYYLSAATHGNKNALRKLKLPPKNKQ